MPKKATQKKKAGSKKTNASTRKKATQKKTSSKKDEAVVVDELAENGTVLEIVNDEMNDTEKKRADWETNQLLIQEAMVKLLKKKKRKPTTAELAEATGLGVRTIWRHVKSIKFEMQGDTWRTLTPEVMRSMYKQAVAGRAFQQKMWFQIVEGWSEDINLNHGAQETLADVIAASTGVKLRKDIEKNAKSNR